MLELIITQFMLAFIIKGYSEYLMFLLFVFCDVLFFTAIVSDGNFQEMWTGYNDREEEGVVVYEKKRPGVQGYVSKCVRPDLLLLTIR